MQTFIKTEQQWRGMPVGGLLTLLAFAVPGVLIYSNTLDSPFVFDDRQHIPDNPHIRLNELNLKNIVEAGFKSPASSRPIANISFALNYYFHKYDVMGYHAVNIAIHILTAVFIYLFVQATLTSPALKDKYSRTNLMAFLAALLWLVHPLQTQSVTYIVQRMTSMAAMFYILSFLLYVKGRFAILAKETSRLWFAGCLLSWLLALGSKQIAATLPVFILLYEWYFFQDLSIGWLKRNLRYAAGIFIIFCIVGLVYLGGKPLESIFGGYSHRDFTLIERLLTQFRVVVYYISLLVFPHPGRLNLDHHFAISHSLTEPPTTLLCLLVIVGLSGLAVYLAKRRRLLSFCILWFFGNLVLESSVLGLELIFEHRLYLPSVFVSVAAVVPAYQFIKPKWVRTACFGAVALLFGVWTYQRNGVYADAVTLWQDCVNKSPDKARPYDNLGLAFESQGKLNEAVVCFRKELQLKPDSFRGHNNLGMVLVKQAMFDEAIGHFHKAIQISPDFAKAHSNLGAVFRLQGRFTEAIACFRRAIELEPDNADVHYNIAAALQAQYRLDEAILHYKKTLQINPDDAGAHYKLSVALKSQGKLDEAVIHFHRALQIDPNYKKTRRNLSEVVEPQQTPLLPSASDK
jgi:tetratricopeptide (TPR) repeat protein